MDIISVFDIDIWPFNITKYSYFVLKMKEMRNALLLFDTFRQRPSGGRILRPLCHQTPIAFYEIKCDTCSLVVLFISLCFPFVFKQFILMDKLTIVQSCGGKMIRRCGICIHAGDGGGEFRL